MVVVPNVAPDTPPLRKNPVFAYFSDPFERPQPFRPDVVVSIDDVAEKKLDMLDAHTSQFYEWMPWVDGKSESVPPPGPERRRWLAAQWLPAVPEAWKPALARGYGRSRRVGEARGGVRDLGVRLASHGSGPAAAVPVLPGRRREVAAGREARVVPVLPGQATGDALGEQAPDPEDARLQRAVLDAKPRRQRRAFRALVSAFARVVGLDRLAGLRGQPLQAAPDALQSRLERARRLGAGVEEGPVGVSLQLASRASGALLEHVPRHGEDVGPRALDHETAFRPARHAVEGFIRASIR